MENKILAICSYQKDLLKALIKAQTKKVANIIIIGNKNKIVETCYIHNINYRLFEIIDCNYELDICFKANELIKQRKIKTIIFGTFPRDFQKNIVDPEYEINVLDIPRLKHLIFIATNIKNEYIGFEEKKEAILVAKDFMKLLDIHYCAIGLVSSNPNKTIFIEKNVIKMNRDLSKNLIEIISVKDIFSDYHNLLIFDSLDTTKVFLDTVAYNEDAKYASIKKASTHYVIDASQLRMRDIYFSIFLLNKLRLNTEAG